MNPLKIAIASGKGGTGKTTISTNLAAVAANRGKVAYLDCDVEEPNGHFFLASKRSEYEDVNLALPEVDLAKCTFCNACADICRFSAILPLGKQVLTFKDLCHGCGACTLVCEPKAIREVPHRIGTISYGKAQRSDNLMLYQGLLDIGQSLVPPVIEALIKKASDHFAINRFIFDAPPGTSCPVVTTLKEADVVVLVTEPTPFGLNDLKLAIGVAEELEKPYGVVINRSDIGDDRVVHYCREHQIPILLEFPHQLNVAKAYSIGKLAIDFDKNSADIFDKLLSSIEDLWKEGFQTHVSPDPQDLVYSEKEKLPSLAIDPALQKEAVEVAILSGKGGTGKTSISASLFVRQDNALIADCDVDAANMHLLLQPKNKDSFSFSGGEVAEIDQLLCQQCERCIETCRYDSIIIKDGNVFVEELSCEGCAACTTACPHDAIQMHQHQNGVMHIAETDYGPMVHAKLGVAEENSGKLVSAVRKEAQAIAAKAGLELILVDGSPGIGCPVIASLTGADFSLIVTEPTQSAIHDMKRVIDLTKRFNIDVALCINKSDLNRDLVEEIKQFAENEDIPLIGELPYNASIPKAQLKGKPFVLDDECKTPEFESLSQKFTELLNTIKTKKKTQRKKT